MIEAIFLDFGNTLVDESRFIPVAQMGVVDFVKARSGVNASRDDLWTRLRNTGDGLQPGDPRLREPAFAANARVLTFRRFAQSCGLNLDERETAEMMQAYDRAAAESGLIEGTVEALRRLRGRHRLAILSNGYSGFVHATLVRQGIRGFFDGVYVSQDVNQEKPSRVFYGLAAKALGVPFDHVLMAGDSWTADIAGAKALGMHTCWINPQGLPLPDPALCDLVVTRLAELPGRLSDAPFRA